MLDEERVKPGHWLG